MSCILAIHMGPGEGVRGGNGGVVKIDWRKKLSQGPSSLKLGTDRERPEGR